MIIAMWLTLQFIYKIYIGILNIEGYFDPMLQMIEHGVKYGFIDSKLASQIIVVSSTPEELLQKMREHTPPTGLVKWLDESNI